MSGDPSVSDSFAGGGPSITPSVRAAARLLMGSFLLLGAIVIGLGDWFIGSMLLLSGLFGWWGFKSGVIRSVLALLSLGAIAVWAEPLGRGISVLFARLLMIPVVPSRLLGVICAIALIYSTFAVLAWALQNWHRRRRGPRSRRAHLMGMMLGIGEGAVSAMVIASLVLAIETPMRMALSFQLNQSGWRLHLYDGLNELREQSDHSLLGHVLSRRFVGPRAVLETGGMLALVSRYPGAVDKIKNDPEVKQWIDEDAVIRRVVKEIRLDSDLEDAIRHGDTYHVLQSPTVLRLWDDAELAQTVMAHQDQLVAAMLRSVPPEYQTRLYGEVAALRGLLERYSRGGDKSPVNASEVRSLLTGFQSENGTDKP